MEFLPGILNIISEVLGMFMPSGGDIFFIPIRLIWKSEKKEKN